MIAGNANTFRSQTPRPRPGSLGFEDFAREIRFYLRQPAKVEGVGDSYKRQRFSVTRTATPPRVPRLR